MHVLTDANDSPPLTDDEGGGDSGDNTETTQSSADRAHVAPTSALGSTGALGAAVIGAAMQAVHTGVCARAPRTHHLRCTAGRAKNVVQQLPPAQLMYTASPAQAQLSAVHTQIDQLLREARLSEEKIATERSMSGHVWESVYRITADELTVTLARERADRSRLEAVLTEERKQRSRPLWHMRIHIIQKCSTNDGGTRNVRKRNYRSSS